MGQTIGFLGLGKMAFGVLGGMLSGKLCEPDNINGFDISPERVELFRTQGCRIKNTASEVVRDSEVVILAVKPQNFPDLFAEIKDALTTDKLIVSIAAGISIDYIKQLAQCSVPVVRAMPNAPMLLSEGATVLAADDLVTDEQFAYVDSVFSSCGVTKRVKESEINSIITIHSSSPAYIFLFARAVREYAQSVGLDGDMAVQLFSQTLKGSAAMINDSGKDLDELIAMVTSPGGTTRAALDEFERLGFCDCIMSAMNACTRRAEELGKAK